MVPADDHAIVLPCASVMVIMVLLKDALTCATPDAMFLRSRRRTRVASFPILDPFVGSVPRLAPQPSRLERLRLQSQTPKIASGMPAIRPHAVFIPSRSPLLLLARNRLCGPLAGAGVGVRALAANRQTAPMPQPSVA